MIASRSPIVSIGIRAASPLAIVVGLYLLFAGHNRPGGGFAAGLVFGAVVILRTVAGLQRPRHALTLITGGMVIVGLTALGPLVWGAVLLDQPVVSVGVPVLGDVKTGGALPFDIGVTAIVVGLVIALLDGLAAGDLTDGPGPEQA